MKVNKDILKNIIKSIVVLAVIAAISGFLLGFFNDITYVSEEESVNRELNKLFPADSYELVYENSESKLFKAKIGEDEFYLAKADGEGGYAGIVPVYVKFENDATKEIKVGTNQETFPQAFEPAYLNQFLNKNATETQGFSTVGGEGTVQIDAATGATKSSRAIMDGADKALRAYREFNGFGESGDPLDRELREIFPANSYKLEVETDIAKIFKASTPTGEFFIASAEGEGGFGGNVSVYLKIEKNIVTAIGFGTNKETFPQAFEESYLSQYLGKNVNEISGYSISGTDSSVKIDTATGATKSSVAITDGADKAIKAYKEFME